LANLLSLEEPRALERVIETVQKGGVVAIPTDTVYGLAAHLAFADALERIYTIKGRDHAKPLPVLLSSPERHTLVAEPMDTRADALVREFWPGPLTVAVPARSDLPPQALAPDGTVGLRVPDHSVALAIIERGGGGALAVTSANQSGQEPACTAPEVEAQLGETVDLILDGGIAPCGLPSTVVRAGDATISIIREGAIARSTIARVWSGICLSGASR
jgi:L-threonylcarbamoyladenylate synthase